MTWERSHEYINPEYGEKRITFDQWYKTYIVVNIMLLKLDKLMVDLLIMKKEY